MSSNSEAQQRPELPATHASTALSPQHPLHQSTVNSRPAPSAQPLHQTELYDNDLPQILNALSFISVDNVINFGLNLKVSRSTIVGFERQYNGNMKDCLREILNERLKQEPPLTWHDIVTALRSPSVCEDRLASQIESQYMTHSQPPSSVPQHPGTQLSSVPQHPQCQHSYLIHSQYPSLLTPSLCSHHEPQFYFNQLCQSPCKPIIVPRPYPVHTQSQASSHTLETSPHFVSTLSGFAITSSTTNTTQSNIRSQASTSSTDTTQSPAVSRGSVEQVKTSIENFECEFSDLKSTAREELSDRESQDSTFLGRFCDHLVDLPLSKKTLHKKFFHESKNDIVNAKSIREQFFILGGYCNYTNYGIIHHIIKRFCGELLKRRMEVYQESLTMFEMDTPVNIYLCAITSNDPNSVIHQKFNRMVLKINKPTSLCRLHEIRALTEAMGENSSVYPYCMYIGA